MPDIEGETAAIANAGAVVPPVADQDRSAAVAVAERERPPLSPTAREQLSEAAGIVRRGTSERVRSRRRSRMDRTREREHLVDQHEGSRANEVESERSQLFTHIRSRLIDHDKAYELDHERRIEQQYGSSWIGRVNASLAGADIKGGPSVLDELVAKGKKIAFKSGASAGVAIVTLGVFGAASVPVLGWALAGGVAGRAAIEGIRVMRGKERKERGQIEEANKVFMDYLVRYYDDTEKMRLALSREHGEDYDIESDPDYVGRVMKIFEMLEDDSKRRVVQVQRPAEEGKFVSAYEAVDVDAEDTEEMINIGNKEKALRKQEKTWETISDLTSAVTSLGAGVAAKVMVGKKLATELGRETAKPLIEQLQRGELTGPFDFDHDKFSHMIQLVKGNVRFVVDAAQNISYYIGSGLEGVKSAIVASEIARYTASQFGALAAMCGFGGITAVLRPTADAVSHPAERLDEEIKQRVEETKRGVQSILQRHDVEPAATGQRVNISLGGSGAETAGRERTEAPVVGSTMWIPGDPETFWRGTAHVTNPEYYQIQALRIVRYELGSNGQQVAVLSPIAAPGVAIDPNLQFIRQPLEVITDPEFPITFTPPEVGSADLQQEATPPVAALPNEEGGTDPAGEDEDPFSSHVSEEEARRRSEAVQVGKQVTLFPTDEVVLGDGWYARIGGDNYLVDGLGSPDTVREAIRQGAGIRADVVGVDLASEPYNITVKIVAGTEAVGGLEVEAAEKKKPKIDIEHAFDRATTWKPRDPESLRVRATIGAQKQETSYSLDSDKEYEVESMTFQQGGNVAITFKEKGVAGAPLINSQLNNFLSVMLPEAFAQLDEHERIAAVASLSEWVKRNPSYRDLNKESPAPEVIVEVVGKDREDPIILRKGQRWVLPVREGDPISKELLELNQREDGKIELIFDGAEDVEKRTIVGTSEEIKDKFLQYVYMPF